VVTPVTEKSGERGRRVERRGGVDRLLGVAGRDSPRGLTFPTAERNVHLSIQRSDCHFPRVGRRQEMKSNRQHGVPGAGVGRERAAGGAGTASVPARPPEVRER
jgi:hypothetical protein